MTKKAIFHVSQNSHDSITYLIFISGGENLSDDEP